MSEQNPSRRAMQLTTPLGSDALMLTELQGSEAISELYAFRLHVQAPKRKPIVFSTLLGQDVRVDIQLPTPTWAEAMLTGKLPELQHRRFCGVVQQITEKHSDTHFIYYSLDVQPRFWLWTQKSDCRIFQEWTVPQILEELLEDLIVEFRLRSDYTQRPYCVQYNETTYDFAARLMAEEGIFYFFEHQYEGQDNQTHQQGERLVITDSVLNLPSVLSPSDQNENIPIIKFDEAQGGNRSELRIQKWHRSQQIVTTKCSLRDHSFQLPGQSLETEEEITDQVSIGDQNFQLSAIDHELEAYAYPGNYAKQFDGIGPGGGERPDSLTQLFQKNQAFAQREIQRHASESIKIEAVSDCPQMIVGHKFSLSKDGVFSGPYFLKSVQHHAKLNADFRAGESQNPGASIDPKQSAAAHSYTNHFTCQAESQPFQPARPKLAPRIYGFQTATVVGPEGEEVFSDKYGRIKVQFHWDRDGINDADSSCWVRVAQVWAGNRWGAFFWPRIGHEVVVSFENGDPDLPLIIGSVYNAKNMPPMPLPERLHSCGIKSCSIGGNPLENFSCTIFHDGKDQEYLQLHSETHECVTSESAKLNVATGMALNMQGEKSGILGLFGSGSGGGPSQPTQMNTTINPSETGFAGHAADQAAASNDSIESHLQQMQQMKNMLAQLQETFGLTGSGSGGMLTGILEGHGSVDVSKLTKGFSALDLGNRVGKLDIVDSAAVSYILESDLEHCFNAKIGVSASLDDLLLMFPGAMIPGFAAASQVLLAACWGVGGDFNQVYGNQDSITYGHQLNVRRGRELSFTEDHFFCFGPNPQQVPAIGALRTIAQKAVKVLAVLTLLMDIGIAIAVKLILERVDTGDNDDAD